MMTQAEIAEYGEKHAEAWLVANGYRCNAGKPHHGTSDIEARSEEENLVVHVLTSRAPSPVPEISHADRGHVITRAMALGFDAWLAQLQIGENGELVGEIQWSQLNH